MTSDQKTYAYHIITHDLPWYINTNFIKAYPVIPIKHEFDNWCSTNLERGGDGTDDSSARTIHERNVGRFKHVFGLDHLEYDADGRARTTFGDGVRRTFHPRGHEDYGIDETDPTANVTVARVGEFTDLESGNRHYSKKHWCCAMFHWGTKRPHWHFIHISSNKMWGHNSNFGRNIRQTNYRCISINCVPCLLEYFYSGNGRQVVQDIIDQSNIPNNECVLHKNCVNGNNSGRRKVTNGPNQEGGNLLFEMESVSPEDGNEGMDAPTDTPGTSNDIKSDKLHVGSGGRNLVRRSAFNTAKRQRIEEGTINDEKLVNILVDNRGFSDGTAQVVLAKEPAGIQFLFKNRSKDKIQTAVSIARILVFQKTASERLEMACAYSLKTEPDLTTDEEITQQVQYIEDILAKNNIDAEKFKQDTYRHFNGITKKRNNLFFYGPPSTGKTLLMNSLIQCHYNYSRLTGLFSASNFNFASLVNTNACFMDECKLTDNQFEQWKLLASSSPMPTDVKYKGTHDVENCRLYTASNYPLEIYVSVPDATRAISTRTIQYNFVHNLTLYKHLTPLAWKKMWNDTT